MSATTNKKPLHTYWDSGVSISDDVCGAEYITDHTQRLWVQKAWAVDFSGGMKRCAFSHSQCLALGRNPGKNVSGCRGERKSGSVQPMSSYRLGSLVRDAAV
jgi:hypothetical protein